MKKSTLDIWEKLQEEGYFENHPLYKNGNFDIPHCVEQKDILNKNVVEIGCGYGRETVFFSNYAKELYAIDVSNTILKKVQKNICRYGSPSKTFLLKPEHCEKYINNIDFVYCLHVFQHITEDQTKEYINLFYKKLNIGGKFLAQFYVGTDKIIENNKEPRIQYTKEEALVLFKNYKIDKTWTLNKFDASNNLQYEHFYVIARKI